MANDGTQGTGNGLLYGVIGALCVVVAGGGFYIYQNSLTAKPAPEAAQAAPAAAATPPAPPVQAAPKPAPGASWPDGRRARPRPLFDCRCATPGGERRFR